LEPQCGYERGLSRAVSSRRERLRLTFGVRDGALAAGKPGEAAGPDPYATAWLKCYYPAEFACSLLNAQPMGFYTPATIVEDAKRHDLVIRPIDVTVSDWDCTLVASDDSAGGFAVRMGLRYVKGLRQTDWQRIEHARRQAAFTSLEDFSRRSGLDEGILSTLAEAGAFERFGTDRRKALWDTVTMMKDGDNV
jgi:DNA polymerase III alpha subunit